MFWSFLKILASLLYYLFPPPLPTVLLPPPLLITLKAMCVSLTLMLHSFFGFPMSFVGVTRVFGLSGFHTEPFLGDFVFCFHPMDLS